MSAQDFEKERLDKLAAAPPEDRLRLMVSAREYAMPLAIRFTDYEIAQILDHARRGRKCNLGSDSLWYMLVTMAADLELARRERPCTYDRAYPETKGTTNVRLHQPDSPIV